MGLFRRHQRDPHDTPVAEYVDGPLCFRIEDVFSIPFKGMAFTGSVESGTFTVGASVTLHLADRNLPAQVGSIEVKRRKRESAHPGDAAAIFLEGIEPDGLPQTFRDGVVAIDTAAIRGMVIRGRQEP